MKEFVRDVLLYLAYGMIIGLVGYALDLSSRDSWIMGATALVLITIGDAIVKRVTRTGGRA